jgi:hypothetical protein
MTENTSIDFLRIHQCGTRLLQTRESPLVNMTTIRRAFMSERVRFRNLMLAVLLVVALPLCNACAGVLPKSDEPIADIYEKISPAVVTITLLTPGAWYSPTLM